MIFVAELLDGVEDIFLVLGERLQRAVFVMDYADRR